LDVEWALEVGIDNGRYGFIDTKHRFDDCQRRIMIDRPSFFPVHFIFYGWKYLAAITKLVIMIHEISSPLPE
jgi:hypothetical protein